MALDYYLWNNDTTAFLPYLKLPVQVSNFFMHHFPNTSSDGKVYIWPAQARGDTRPVHTHTHTLACVYL